MANDLVKTTSITVISGSPGTPARPAYTYQNWVPGVCGYSAVYEYELTLDGELTLVGYTRRCEDGHYETVTVPAQTAIAATPDTIVSDYHLGWNNAGGLSLGTVTVPKKFEFAVSASAAGVVCGLTPSSLNEGLGYYRIRYGFNLSSNRWRIFEAGVAKTEYALFTPSTTRFAVEWDGRDIFYLVNDVVVYKSTLPFPGTSATEPLVGVAALYYGGDSVLTPEFEALLLQGGVATNLLPLSGFTADTAKSYSFASLLPLEGRAAQKTLEEAAGSFRPLRSYSSNNANYAYGDTDLAPLTGSATGRKINQAAGTFTALAGLASNKPYAASNAALKPLESLSEGGLLHPNPARSATAFARLVSFSIGLTGQIGGGSGSLSPMVGLTADRPYGQSQISLLPLTGQAREFLDPPGEFYGRYGSYSLDAFAAEGVLEGVSASYGSYVCTARLGHKAAPKYGGYALSATLTPNSGVVARASLSYDGYGITANALVGSIGRAVLSYALKTSLESYTGAQAGLEYQGYAASITATTGAVTRYAGTYRGYALTASLSGTIYARAVLSGGRFAPRYGIARTSFSSYAVLSLGVAVVASQNVAYVMNRRTETMSRYTNYGFDHIVYFAGRYYGVKADGIYLLEGDTDAGTSINARVKTSKLDFGTMSHKRVSYGYIGNAADIDVTLSVDGVQQGVYRSEHGAKRVKLPRGAKGRYSEIEIANVNGNRLSINGVELIAEILSRRA